MDARTKWLLIVTMIVGIIIAAVMIRIEPRLISWILWSLTATFLMWVILIVAVTILIAAFLTPPTPLSETSILGRWVVGLTKVALALLAFFANTAASWLLSVSVLRPSTTASWTGSPPEQIWSILLQTFTIVAFLFGMGVAIDVIRSGRPQRVATATALHDTWIAPHLDHPADTITRAICRALAGTHGAIVVVSFCVAPAAVTAPPPHPPPPHLLTRLFVPPWGRRW